MNVLKDKAPLLKGMLSLDQNTGDDVQLDCVFRA